VRSGKVGIRLDGMVGERAEVGDMRAGTVVVVAVMTTAMAVEVVVEDMATGMAGTDEAVADMEVEWAMGMGEDGDEGGAATEARNEDGAGIDMLDARCPDAQPCQTLERGGKTDIRALLVHTMYRAFSRDGKFARGRTRVDLGDRTRRTSSPS